MAGIDGEAGDARGRHWQDGGFWLLPPLMLLALLAFRRGGAVAAVLLLAILPLRPAAAFELEDLWSRPDQQVHERLVRGADAYRSGEFEQAAQAWSGLPGADAQYNLGNALAKAGRYRDAIEAYDRALAREPGMADAIANRAAVQALLDRMPPGSGGEGDEGDRDEEGEGQEGGGAGSPAGADPSGSRGDPSSTGEGSADPSQAPPDAAGAKGGDDAESPPSQVDPADAEAQRAADAAQRERMARALQAREDDAGREDGPAAAAGQPRPGETPAEREQRIANQAWLQRVPDDPGGLLRRKFALEYQRRQLEGIR